MTKEQAEQNRRLIVETAARLFRLHGMENVAVADVMKECGFTHGGFYNHFSSKEDLATEAVACAFDATSSYLSEGLSSQTDPDKALTSTIAAYLSPKHRDSCTGGCPAAALSVDAARSGAGFQAAFADGIETYLEQFAARMEGTAPEARQKAVALLSGMVGALLLSRAVKKGRPQLSDELINSAREQFCRAD